LQARGQPQVGTQGADSHVPVPIPVPGSSPSGAEQRHPPCTAPVRRCLPRTMLLGDTDAWCELGPCEAAGVRSRLQRARAELRGLGAGPPPKSTPGLGWEEWRSSSRTSICSPARAAKYNQWDRCPSTAEEEAEGSRAPASLGVWRHRAGSEAAPPSVLEPLPLQKGAFPLLLTQQD